MLVKNNATAIACASGGFKAVFVHGVLSAFEAENFRPNAYSAASASVVVAALANMNKVREAGIDYWLRGMEIYDRTKSMSRVSLAGIDYLIAHSSEIFNSFKSEFFIATSKVITKEAARQTQSKQASRLGKKLLIAAAKGDRDWAERYLRLNLFSTLRKDSLALNRDNFKEVAYASTRMLHNYDLPAWIDRQAYIDASYTCSCPALEMVERGYQTVIAIATEAGKFYRDLFQSAVIPSRYNQVPIHIIQPDINLKKLGVNFFQATPTGLTAVYQHGLDKGRTFLTQSKRQIEESNHAT